MSDVRRLASPAEVAIVEGLRDEATFMMLVDQHQAAMLRIAQMYVSPRAVAEEVVQEAWLGIVKGLDRFEGRSSLRTWILRIVSNVAKTRGQAEGRTIPFSSLAGDDAAGSGIDPGWFQDDDGPSPGGWKYLPRRLERDSGGPALGNRDASADRTCDRIVAAYAGGSDPVA